MDLFKSSLFSYLFRMIGGKDFRKSFLSFELGFTYIYLSLLIVIFLAFAIFSYVYIRFIGWKR